MNNRFFKAILCVTFFSVLTRTLGFFLKIYLSRSLGTTLLGSYQVAMSIFGVLMTLVSSGIPIVLSRNVSFYAGKHNKKAIGSIVSSGLILTGVICFVVSIIVLFFPNLLNLLFTSNASSEMIIILLPALISSSIYEVLRGALWGMQSFFTISFTEFIEQVTRIIILIILFKSTFFKMSLTNKTALSLSLACVISSIIVSIIYFKKGGSLANPKNEFHNLLKTSSPITAVRTVSSIVTSIIAIIIPIRLTHFGFSKTEALSEFGIMMGMTFPLIMIPSTLISSLAVTIIPSISEQSNNIDDGKLKDTSILKSKVNFSVKTAVVFSSLLLSTFIALGIPIGQFIYNNSKAGLYLSFAAITMIPMGLSQITSSILNAIGLEMKSLNNYIFSSALLILSILYLPKYLGTYSLIIGYIAMSISASVLNVKMLAKRKLIDFQFVKTIISMLGITALSILLGNSIYYLFGGYSILALLVSSCITCGSTMLLIYTFNIANFKIVIFKKAHN